MSLYINIKVNNTGLLDQIGSIGFAPIRYFNGHTFTNFSGTIEKRRPSFENHTWWKTTLAVIALIPGLIIGTPFRLLALCFEDVQEQYKSAFEINHSITPLTPPPPKQRKIGPVKEIAPGVFTAEGISPKGEKLYFAMESKLDEKEKNKWENYKTSASLFVTGNIFMQIGKLTELATCINDPEKLNEFLSKQKLNSKPFQFWDGDSKTFEYLKQKLEENKILPGSSKAEELTNLLQAMNGLNPSQSHMIYVSKSPITGRANFDSKSDRFDLKEYISRYGNIIMSVGSDVSGVVENRGIFRNPWSLVEGGHTGIAMMLHSFTGMVVKKHYPSAKQFRVRPFGKMAQIVASQLPREEILINGIRGDHYVGKFDNGQGEKDFRIPINVLASSYA